MFISITDLFIEGIIIWSSLLSNLENAEFRWSQSRLPGNSSKAQVVLANGEHAKWKGNR